MMPNPDQGPSPGSSSLPAVVQPLLVATPAARPAAPPPALKLDPIALLKALRRRWLLTLIAAPACAAIAAGVGYLMVPPAKYMARAMLRVDSVPPQILMKLNVVLPDYG